MSRGYLHERGSAQYDALTDSQTVIFTEYGFRARTVNFDRKRPRNGHPVHDAETVERPELKAPQAGSTVLDRVHQAMILFATGRGEALGGSSSRRGSARTPDSGNSPNRSPRSIRQASTRSDGLTAFSHARRAWVYNRVRRHPMRTITIEVPDNLPLAVAASDEDLSRAFRLAVAIFWYDRGLISQGKGAEIAGLTRAEFIDELGRANVSAIQTSVEELRAELEQARNARR